MTELEIRLARRGDETALARLSADTFVETFAHLYKEEDLSAFLKQHHARAVYETALTDDGCRIWLAEVEGRAAGYAFAAPCTLPVPDMPPNAGELSRLYVLAAMQGRGLGERLLDLVLDWLEEAYDDIYLSVWSENVGAQRLYARRGFVKIAEYDFMVGAHADREWIMRRAR